MIRVYVVKQKTGRFRMYWTDPRSRKRVYRSTKCIRRRDAERIAKDMEETLNAAPASEVGSARWEDEWERYVSEHLGGLREKTQVKAEGVASCFEQKMSPGILYDVTPKMLSAYVGTLRKEDYSEQTIASHLRQLKAFLRWCVDQGTLAACPRFPKIRVVSGTRISHGRPLSDEEFREIEAAALRAERQDLADVIRGLWLSGLRLGEAMVVTFDASEFQVDLSGDRPYYRIWGGAEKGKETRLLAMTPDAAEFFAGLRGRTRPGQRKVFNLGRKSLAVVSRQVTELATKAVVTVLDSRGRKRPAGCHDLRRSFGERWATRVTPQVLMELMRHKSISTTMTYYVTANAKRTSDVVWKFGADLGAKPTPPEGEVA